jgi:hypothetical protein
MSLLDWTTFPQIFTDYHIFTMRPLEDGDLYFIYGSVPIRKELIEAQKQPVLDLLNGNECETDFNAYDEKFVASIDIDIAKEQDESDVSCIDSDDYISEFSKSVEAFRKKGMNIKVMEEKIPLVSSTEIRNDFLNSNELLPKKIFEFLKEREEYAR